MRKYLLAGVAAAAIGGFALAPSAAHAGTISVTNAAVTIWNFTNTGGSINDPNQQALPTNPEVSNPPLYTGTYTGPIDFLKSSGDNTIAGFLNSATGGNFTDTGSSQFSDLNTTISSSGFKITTLMDFQISLSNNVNGSITHDDGISIWNSDNTSSLVDASKPTSAEATSYTLPAGTYNLWYVEANGLPAELNMSGTETPVPEPGSLALLGTALLGLGFIGWTMKKRRDA